MYTVYMYELLFKHMSSHVVNILEFLFFEHVGQSLTQGDGPVSPLHIDQLCIDLLAADPECHLGIYTLLLIITTLT